MRFLIDIPLEEFEKAKANHEEIREWSLAGIVSNVISEHFKNTIVSVYDLVCPQCGSDDLEWCSNFLYRCKVDGTKISKNGTISYEVNRLDA